MSAIPERAEAGTPAPSGLSELEERILGFERDGRSGPAAREAAIRAEFGVSAARYYQMLYQLIDSPLALRRDPLLVRRLQRLREMRRRARAARVARTEYPDSID